jgi:hypothetical protein
MGVVFCQSGSVTDTEAPTSFTHTTTQHQIQESSSLQECKAVHFVPRALTLHAVKT